MIDYLKKSTVFLLLLAVLSSGASGINSAEASAQFNMDLKNVSVADLVRTMSKLTGKNFLLDNNVNGTITLVAPTPVSTDEAWRIFLTVLTVKNLALEKVGSVYKVIVAKEAVQHNMPIVYGKAYYADNDQMIVRLIPLAHNSASELESFLKNFKGKNGNMYTFASANMLVVVDTSRNINRMLRLIERLDQPPVTAAREVVLLKHGDAAEMVKLMSEVFDLTEDSNKKKTVRRKKQATTDDSGYRTNVIAEPRTNSIILVGPRAEFETLISFIEEFDRPVAAGTGKIHVYYLKNADATSLSETLAKLTQGAGATNKKKKDSTSDVAQFEGGIKITADKETNSLIIVSSSSDFTKLQTLIKKLDRPRQQVYVEAAVVEVQVGSNFELGANLIAGAENVGDQDLTVFGGTGLGNSGIASVAGGLAGGDGNAGLATGLLGLNGIFGGALATFGDNLPPIGVLVRAAQGEDSINVLSTPHLLTSDNQEAEIIVGDNVPFISGSSVAAGGIAQQRIERKDVGLTLRITPQINESNRIKLDIYQEISSVSTQNPAGVDVNTQGLITRKRSAKTTVVANDRQTIVIGGLISNTDSQTVSKVPFLGDIPIIGRFFRTNNRQKRKTNLLIFLSPKIVRDAVDYNDYAVKRASEFWQVTRQAPSRIGFDDYFEKNLVGWEEGEYSENEELTESYESKGVDREITEGFYADSASDEVAEEATFAESATAASELTAPAAETPATVTEIAQ